MEPAIPVLQKVRFSIATCISSFRLCPEVFKFIFIYGISFLFNDYMKLESDYEVLLAFTYLFISFPTLFLER